jgi:hypothetical protein
MSDLAYIDAAIDALNDRLDRLEANIDALEIRFDAAKRLSDTFTDADHDAASSDRIARGES